MMMLVLMVVSAAACFSVLMVMLVLMVMSAAACFSVFMVMLVLMVMSAAACFSVLMVMLVCMPMMSAGLSVPVAHGHIRLKGLGNRLNLLFQSIRLICFDP